MRSPDRRASEDARNYSRLARETTRFVKGPLVGDDNDVTEGGSIRDRGNEDDADAENLVSSRRASEDHA